MNYALYSLPLAFGWVALTNQLTLEGFLVGYALSLGLTVIFRPPLAPIRAARLPDQVMATIQYVALLFIEIVVSSIDVARRVLSPDMHLKSGVIAVNTLDSEKDEVIAALSADAITLTPGELVIEIEDNSIMYVHTMDVEETAAKAEDAQRRRLHLLQRITGKTS
jgi:multisubunit Na+/H+ antiporter MnhE subunit